MSAVRIDLLQHLTAKAKGYGTVESLTPLIKQFTHGMRLIGIERLHHSLPDLIQIAIHSLPWNPIRALEEIQSALNNLDLQRLGLSSPKNRNISKFFREFLLGPKQNAKGLTYILLSFLIEICLEFFRFHDLNVFNGGRVLSAEA